MHVWTVDSCRAPRLLAHDAHPQPPQHKGKAHAHAHANAPYPPHRAVIDNLVKGASGQAIQNLNLVMGLPESTGLMQQAMFP